MIYLNGQSQGQNTSASGLPPVITSPEASPLSETAADPGHVTPQETPMNDMTAIRAVAASPKITMVDLDKLVITKTNVRRHGERDIDSMAASIKAKGLIQPLLVRPLDDGTFDVVVGGRRTLAFRKLMKDGESISRVPCIVSDIDDAAAIAASLAENIERLPMDTLDQFEAFLKLSKLGMSEAAIAASFGITEQLVTRRLALAKLASGIKALYRADEIDDAELQLLTLAPAAKQREYLALSDKGRRPPRWNLKAWILGGCEIATSVALFDLATYSGPITRDLFGEDSYFGDAEQFWSLQNGAVASLKDELEGAGWPVTVFGPDEQFRAYDYEKRSKDKGGKAIIAVHRDGRVEIHKGVLETKLAAKADKVRGKADATGDTSDAEAEVVVRPELTEPLSDAVERIRHSLVRAKLVTASDCALRIAVAQLIAGAEQWEVKRSWRVNEAGEAHVAGLPSETVMAEKLKAAKALLGKCAKTDDDRLVSHSWERDRTVAIYERLKQLSLKEVLDILAVVVAETLAVGTKLIDAVGTDLCVDVAKDWSATPEFLGLIRDKDVLGAMLAEVAGKEVAKEHVTATGKVKREAIQTAIAGKTWAPRWMAFPQARYTKRKLTQRQKSGA